MKPAEGEYPYITRLIRQIERDEDLFFGDFRNGLVIKRTKPPRATQIYYGQHVVTEDMVDHRPTPKKVTSNRSNC